MMNIDYIQSGDYQIPDLTLRPKIGNYGRFGQMRESFLRQHRKGMYEEMRLLDSLHDHLMEIDREANGMLETLETRLLENDPLPKTEDMMFLTQHRNRIRHQSEEIVLRDLIHS